LALIGTALIAFVASGGAGDRVRAANTTTSLGVTTSTSDYLGSTEYECGHHVQVLDAGPYESLELVFEGSGVVGFSTFGCTALPYASSNVDEGAVTGPSGEWWVGVTGLDTLPAATPFLQCRSWDYWGRGDPLPDPVDFADFRVWAVAASGIGVRLPRVCVTGIACEDVRNQLDWRGDPACGDADYDGDLSAADAAIALGASVGSAVCSPDPYSCDIDADGVVTATDALGILQRAVGLPLDLACRPPCLPGTFGPPGENRTFEIDFSVLLPISSALQFSMVVDYTGAGGTIPVTGELSDCEPQGFFGIAELDDGRENTLNIVIDPPLAPTTAPEVFLTCRFEAEGASDPDPARFTIETAAWDTKIPIENLVAISGVRIPSDQYAHY
jgi:hypothetical protein